MRHLRLSLLTICLGTSLLSNVANAAAFQLYEQGTPIIGTAAVGQAANTSDASTAYFNPAGMAALPSSEFMLGSQMIFPNTHFSPNTANTISGGSGGNAGTLTPGMSMYYVYSYAPRLKLGVALTSPYGGSLTYDDGWVGRYNVQNAFFYTINLNPSLALQVNKWLAVGAGVSVEYMSLQQTTALPLIPLVDGQINVKVTDYAPGANFGVMLTPSKATTVGIAYRSQITHDMHGNITFLRITDQPNTSTKMVMPQNVIASWTQDLSDRFTLLTELGWSNWSSMKNTTLNVAGYSVVTPLNWNDTYRVGLGGKFKVTPAFVLQAGASYDSSPTSTANRLPVLPMDRQVRLGVGFLYTMHKIVKLGMSYEYWNLGNAPIHNTSSAGVLAGSYSTNFANTLQASINVEI